MFELLSILGIVRPYSGWTWDWIMGRPYMRSMFLWFTRNIDCSSYEPRLLFGFGECNSVCLWWLPIKYSRAHM